MIIYHAKPLMGYLTKPSPKPIICSGCGRSPNHTKAYAVGKETIHCPRCDREVIRPLGNNAAIHEWNELNRAKG